MDSQYILMVEDDPTVQMNNKKILERRGYILRQAFTLAEARKIIEQEQPCAIILDIKLPDGNGLDFLKDIRRTSNVPVLILTALDTPADVIRGLETGGDAYLPKPYNLNVFISHVEALLRRGSTLPEIIVYGPFKLDLTYVTAYLREQNMYLTPKEFSLLLHFIQHPDAVFSAKYLYKNAWGQPMEEDTSAVKNQIYNLRKKIKCSGYTITAVRGEGYIFELQ
ncbi:MAG TPA: response regulator transcription factor [Clostridiaceae bacterium]|nr:response regulator transcription factor [Clostridiaceae bacterium]